MNRKLSSENVVPTPLQLWNNEKSLLCVGIISEPYHMQGMVRIKTFTSHPENICTLKCYDKDGNRLIIEQSTSRKATYRVKGITTRTEAEQSVGMKIYVKRDELPPAEKDEFYIEDLVNLPVLGMNEQKVGYVLACHNFGAGDIVEVMFGVELGKESEMYLFTRENFPEVRGDAIVISTELIKT